MLPRSLLILFIAAVVAAPSAPIDKNCEGFVPENDLRLEVTPFQEGGITEEEFTQVLDKIEAHFAPIVEARGKTLKVNRQWSSGIVNASAQQIGDEWVINMYGGLARHKVMTADGYMLVACHEMGHHVGGAPKVASLWSKWASNEGAADYYSTLRCLRDMFTDEENTEFVKYNDIDETLRLKCEEVYQTQEEENFCMRMGMAGTVAGAFFADLRKIPPPRFDTPDPKVVARTSDQHPEAQCRLDTYFQGALCVNDRSIELSDADYRVGTCHTEAGHTVGLRPLCWFKP